MAEVGLLPFARIALQVSRAVLPRYRSRFSKHQFTQPQLLAILCLMRYEDWTFREAEVRLSEHRELRQVLGLGSVPDFTTLYRFLQRLDDQTIDRAVGETVRRWRASLRQGRKRARVAVEYPSPVLLFADHRPLITGPLFSSPLQLALTKNAPATLLESALTKKDGGRG
jgi:hypothetical protein